MEYTRWQKALAEFVGPLALVFVGGGAAIMASFGAGGAGLVTVALAHGLVIATMVSAVGHVSGGHLNPAVTIGAWVTQKISTGLAAVYIVAQLAGGLAGAFLLKAALPSAIFHPQGSPGSAALTTVTRGIGNGQAVLIEAMLTFFLVWVVFATAIDPNGSFGKIAGLAIGFVIAMDAMMGGPITGASMNPARSLGPAIADGKFSGLWVYFVGPIAGGIVAAALYDGVLLRRREEPSLEATEEEASLYGAGAEPVEEPLHEEPHGFGAHGDVPSTGETSGGAQQPSSGWGTHGEDESQ